MRVVNEPSILRFIRKYPDSRRWLENWLEIVRVSGWDSIDVLHRTYPSADGGVRVRSGGTVTVFNVSGNKYRLIVSIIYSIQTIIVLDLMTHAEYSKDHWKKRL